MFHTKEDFEEGMEEFLDEEPEYVQEKVERLDEIDEGLREHEERMSAVWEAYKEKAEAAREESKPFVPDRVEGQEEYVSQMERINEAAQELSYKGGEILQEGDDKLFDKRIEEIRENVSEHWADRFEKTKERIKKDLEIERQKIIEAEENGEDYFEPNPSPLLRRLQLETDMELAVGGMTPDALYEPVDDLRGIYESQDEYFETKDWLLERLDKIPYEKAVELLQKRYDDGEVGPEDFEAMQRTLRLHYGA